MLKLTPFKTIDEYIVQFPPQTQAKLQEIRKLVHQLAPDIVETIAYGIPTFKLKGKNLVHMAGYEHHIGFYPGSEAIQFFAEKLQEYKTSKGTVQFSLEKALPTGLFKQMIEFRIKKLS